MVIDGHAHASREFASIDSLCKTLDKAGVDKVVLCPSLKNNTKLGPPPKIFNGNKERSIEKVYALNRMIRFTYMVLRKKGDPNQFVYDLHRALPERVLQFYWIDCRKKEALDLFNKRYDDWQFCGVKLHQGWNPFSFDSPLFHTLLESLEEKQLPLFVHPSKKSETAKLCAIAKEHPTVPIIIGHLMGSEIGKKYTCDNLFHDISPTNLRTDLVLDAINTYGAMQIIFGSDMPFGNLADNLKKVDSLPISTDQKELLLGGAIKPLLKL